MAKSIGNKPPVYTRASQLRLDDRPDEYSFGLQRQQSKVGAGVSTLAHVALVAVFLLVLRLAPQALPPEITDPLKLDFVFLPIPGPGGGGGGGDKTPEPPRKVEVAKPKDAVSVPTQKPPAPVPDPPKDPPAQPMTLPFQQMSAAEMTLPGSVNPSTTTSAGSGTGSGAGPGTGSGMGPGHGGGFGGGAYRPGAGITLPSVVREVKPAYTADAMRAKVQGSVWLECIVMPDGSVGDVKVTRSLDPIFGLDQEAIKAAKQWRFRPGMRQGEPVPVIITIELTFTLR
jgi:periplasmic protein TonB